MNILIHHHARSRNSSNGRSQDGWGSASTPDSNEKEVKKACDFSRECRKRIAEKDKMYRKCAKSIFAACLKGKNSTFCFGLEPQHISVFEEQGFEIYYPKDPKSDYNLIKWRD